MASAVHCQLNPQVRLFVPTAMTPKLAYSTVQQYSTVQYRRGKREEGEEPVSKHQIRPGDGRWTGRRGGCVCVCVFFPSILDISSLDVPAGVTQEAGHTGFLIHLPSAVRALIFVARRIQPFLSLVDREVEFCVLTN